MRIYQDIPHPDSNLAVPTNHKTTPARTVTVHIGESVLTWLYAHKRISTAQLHAGNSLQKDFMQARLMPRTTMQWGECAAIPKSKHASTTANDAPIAVLDARRRFDAAMDYVGPGLSDICWRTICAGEAIGDAERGLSWPARSGRLVLTLALDRLVKFYHIHEYV